MKMKLLHRLFRIMVGPISFYAVACFISPTLGNWPGILIRNVFIVSSLPREKREKVSRVLFSSLLNPPLKMSPIL